MKSRKVLKIAIIVLVIFLSPALILYWLMRPRDPGFTYRFLDGHKPIQIGIAHQLSGVAIYEFAVYSWSGNFVESVKKVQSELPDFVMTSHSPELVDFEAKNGTVVELQAVRLSKGKLTFRDQYDVPDQKSVTIFASRLLPEDSFTELRFRYLGTHFPE